MVLQAKSGYRVIIHLRLAKENLFFSNKIAANLFEFNFRCNANYRRNQSIAFEFLVQSWFLWKRDYTVFVTLSYCKTIRKKKSTHSTSSTNKNWITFVRKNSKRRVLCSWSYNQTLRANNGICSAITTSSCFKSEMVQCWCRELAAVFDCGIPWTFVLTFSPCEVSIERHLLKRRIYS